MNFPRHRWLGWVTWLTLFIQLGGRLATGTTPSTNYHLTISAPAGYLPDLPTLIRLEVINDHGERNWDLWEAEATLESDPPGLVLSTNKVLIRHGLGSALVRFPAANDISLRATLGPWSATRALQALDPETSQVVGGILPNLDTHWSGIIHVTSDVLVPAGYTLTIEPGTVVLIDGVTSGTTANDLSISGTLLALGTDEKPITITCAQSDPAYRWGQIRHTSAQPSLYRATTVTRGGRAFGEGHTATAPAIRSVGSKIRFERCNITDQAETDPASGEFGQPGKILQAMNGSDITLDDCLLSRARMGPEISESALLITNSGILSMVGVNDADGLFLDAQQPGQTILVTHTILVDGDDDGIDTLNAIFTVDHCLIRNWRNPKEDSKGISVEGGEARLWHSLLVDNAIGISGKGENGTFVRVRVDHCTILSENYAVGATNKLHTTPTIDYRITNSILRGTKDSIFTSYNPVDLHISFCNLGEFWPGTGNSVTDPLWVDSQGHDYHLLPHSPCIDLGDPGAAPDPDGSRTDIGYFRFQTPAPRLLSPAQMTNGNITLRVEAYPNRNYFIERTRDFRNWETRRLLRPGTSFIDYTEPAVTDPGILAYRVRLAP